MENKENNGEIIIHLKLISKEKSNIDIIHPFDKLLWDEANEKDQFIYLIDIKRIIPYKNEEETLEFIEKTINNWIQEDSSIRGISLKPKEVVKKLEKLGFIRKSQKGSHVQMTKQDQKGKVTIPIHNGTIKKGTLKSILRQANISLNQLLEV